MIEVDVFWSFAMGASFASLAADGIKRSQHVFINKYFVYNLCFLSMVFAPSGIYLLWHHTGWETMFFLDKSMHGIWPCLFAHTNVSLGVLGFVVCYRMIKAGNTTGVHAVWTTAYTCMFAILTFGYNRFLYPGTGEQWKKGYRFDIPWDFFSCDVFYTLLMMSVFVLPFLYYAMAFWPAEYGITKDEKSQLIKNCLTPYYRVTCLFITGYLLLFVLKQVPSTWGLDRLFAFLIGQGVFGLILFLPVFLIPVNAEDVRRRRLKKKD